MSSEAKDDCFIKYSFYQLMLLCVKESLISYTEEINLFYRCWSWRRFAYLNLCNGDADVVRAIAKNLTMQYIYTYVYLV